jgi:hypothetical protein
MILVWLWFRSQHGEQAVTTARISLTEPSMTKWFGAIALTAAMMVGGAGVTPSAVATAAEVTKAGQAADLSARRHYHDWHSYHYGRHYAYRPYYPYYYGRPYYYSPGPFFPFLPFIHGWEEPWLW